MFSRAYGVCSVTLKKTFRHPRFLLLLILLFIYLDYTLRGVRDFCSAFEVKVSLLELMVQLFSNANTQGCLLLFFAFMILDIPGIDIGEQYILIRSGKGAWTLGKIFTVICLAFTWLLMIILFFCIIVQKLNFCTEWQSGMITLSKTDVYNSYGIRMAFQYKVIVNYPLLRATVLSMSLNLGFAIWGGIFAAFLNFVSHRSIGCFALAVMAFISMSIGGILNSGAIYKFSPASLALLSVIDGGVETAYPTLQYAVLFYIIAACISLTLFSLATNLRKDYSRLKV